MMQNVLAVLPYMGVIAFVACTVLLASHMIEKEMRK
jgi:hypothetical protein